MRGVASRSMAALFQSAEIGTTPVQDKIDRAVSVASMPLNCKRTDSPGQLSRETDRSKGNQR